MHDILPSSDPRSTINPANLDATCGQCHKGVTQKFTRTPVHVDTDGGQAPDIVPVAMRWVRWIYIPLILLVIGGMFLHNAIIWRAKSRRPPPRHAETVIRMTANQRWQHLVLLTSFFVLVITGFALKFPTPGSPHSSAWANTGAASSIASPEWCSSPTASITSSTSPLPRKAAASSATSSPRSRSPDAFGTMLYYLGLRKEKPKFARFNYAEKAEYWALVWGTALMAVTGVMLWAKVWVGNALARWWIDAATAVHFYEAILATLAILVWHFYQVFFDPDVYPMNWAWRDGTMSAEHYEHEHELDTETLAETGPDSNSTKPEQHRCST